MRICFEINVNLQTKSPEAPLPYIKLIPTGGVSLKIATDFIRTSIKVVGVGGESVDLQALSAGHTHLITEPVRQFAEIINAARNISKTCLFKTPNS